MKIRGQLVLAFLLLSVLPLSGIVLYSYYTSRRAVEVASQQQAALVADQIDERMSAVIADVRASVERVGSLPAQTFADLTALDEAVIQREAAEKLLANIGAAAPFVDEFEFTPVTPPVPMVAPAPQVATVQPTPGTHPSFEPIVVDVEAIMAGVRASTPALPVVPADEVSGGATSVAPPAPPAIDETELQKREAARLIEQSNRIAARVAQQQSAIAQRKVAEIEERARSRKIIRFKHPEDRTASGHDRSRTFEVPIMREGTRVGTLKANVSNAEIVGEVLGRVNRREGEIPFAIDSTGKIHSVNEKDRQLLEGIGELDRRKRRIVKNGWVAAMTPDPDSGMTIGVARRIDDSLEQVRRTAARNFVYGLGLIGLALLGVVPVANHMTRDVKLVAAGAERIAAGDLDTSLPVRSRNEFGQLAQSFNGMAADLKRHRERLLEEERLRHEREIEQHRLQSEFERKSEELEQARRFQLSLLPKKLPQHPAFDIAVFMKTATEVGGDYYDFVTDDSGALTAVIGDATGHGASAGTMVTIVKSLFSAYGARSDVRSFLAEASDAIRRMDLGRMAMALTAVRLQGHRLAVAAAGMPPVLVHHAATGMVEEIAIPGMPLGSLVFEYEQRELAVEAGDAVLLMSDGFPELASESGDPVGYARVEEIFRAAAEGPAEQIVSELARAAEEWSGGREPNDDITFVVLKMKA